MTLKDFIIYGAGISGFCMLAFGFLCWVDDHLKDRREDMKLGRALRLGQQAHDYTIAPEDGPFDQETYEDFFTLVDLSDDPAYIEDGIEWLSLHATWAQKPGDELAA